MKLFIITIVFALSSAAQLPSRSYIPQAQGGGGPGGHGDIGFPGGQGGFPGQGGQGGFPGQGGQGGFPGGHIGGGGGSGNQRPQQEIEKNAGTLKQDQAIGEDGSYHFGFETSNGIRAEEAGNEANAQGGFAYKGDDGNTYQITYTAGEGGFRPQGEHLPVAPPTPEAILEALKKNEQDEAAGIFDDGQYRPDQHGGGHAQGAGGQFGSANHQGSFSGNTGYQY